MDKARTEVEAELHAELAQLRERCRRDDEGVTIHLSPVLRHAYVGSKKRW